MTQPASPVPGLSGLVIIARGGYAAVYRAQQDSVGREVALKIDTRTLDDERDRRRFLREAQAAGRMSGHPNIVHMYDAGVTADNHPYLVMELCTGGSYSAKMRKHGPRPASEVRDLGIKIADALQAAHDAGVLHRDVKPANILINRFGVPGLTDFGLAAVLDASRDISVTVEALTPAYAAPEVFKLDTPTAAGDVYSLCATLYALLNGRPPRWPKSGSPPSPLAMVTMHNEPIPDIAGVPAALLSVLRTGMASDPTNRYPSAAALRDALQALDDDGSEPTTPDVVRFANEASSRAAQIAPLRRSSPAVSHRKTELLAMAVILAVLVAAVVATGAYILLRDDTDAVAGALPKPASGPCPFTPANVKCPTTPECFDDSRSGDGVVARACDRPHSWETYAIASLPGVVSGVSREVLRKEPFVLTLCGPRGVKTALGSSSTQFDVKALLPGDDELASGKREFRCLAGLKDGKSTKAWFARSD